MPGVSFNGLIEEIPGLSVDKFNNGASVFLLTHFHSDHLVGLSNISFSGTIYCLEITKALLKNDSRYSHIMKFVRSLDESRQYGIVVGGLLDVKLSLIPAYHCQGAVCFLVESPTANILCTGDLRCEDNWLNSLKRNPFIFSYTTGLNILDNIYLDTSFEYRLEPYIEVPNNFDGIQMAILILKNYPMDDPEIKFAFVDTTSGLEESWINVANSFNGSLQLDKSLRKRLTICNQLEKVFSQDSHGDPKFYVGKFEPATFNVTIKRCIDFNVVDYVGNFLPILLSTVDPEKLTFLKTTLKGNKIYKLNGYNWLLPRGGSHLLPETIKMVFSCHSTYKECCKLVSAFKPRQVYPCTDLKNGWAKGFQMSRIFGKYCSIKQPPSPKDFRYDMECLKKWGPPNGEVRNRAVTCINRWDLESCKAEYQIAKQFLEATRRPLFEFKGQHWVSKFNEANYDEDDALFDLGRRKDMKLQDLVIGRGERAYRKIIEDLQKMYIYRGIDQGKEFLENKDKDDEVIQGYNRRVLKLGSADGYNYDKDSNNTLSSTHSGKRQGSLSFHNSIDIVNGNKILTQDELGSTFIEDKETDIEDTDEDDEIKDEEIVFKQELGNTVSVSALGTYDSPIEILDSISDIQNDNDTQLINKVQKIPSQLISSKDTFNSQLQQDKVVRKRKEKPKLERKRKRFRRSVSIESSFGSYEVSLTILIRKNES